MVLFIPLRPQTAGIPHRGTDRLCRQRASNELYNNPGVVIVDNVGLKRFIELLLVAN